MAYACLLQGHQRSSGTTEKDCHHTQTLAISGIDERFADKIVEALCTKQPYLENASTAIEVYPFQELSGVYGALRVPVLQDFQLAVFLPCGARPQIILRSAASSCEPTYDGIQLRMDFSWQP